MKTIRHWLIAGVRTTSQVLTSAGLAWLAVRGINLPEEVINEAVFAVLSGITAAALNVLEKRWPVIAKVMSWGLSPSGPSYDGN